MIDDPLVEPMSEAQIQKDICEYLRLSGYLVFRMNAGKVRHNVAMCPPGTPDLLAVSPRGRVRWIEVKRPGKHLSHDQELMHEDLQVRNQEVIVAYGVEDVEGFDE